MAEDSYVIARIPPGQITLIACRATDSSDQQNGKKGFETYLNLQGFGAINAG